MSTLHAHAMTESEPESQLEDDKLSQQQVEVALTQQTQFKSHVIHEEKNEDVSIELGPRDQQQQQHVDNDVHVGMDLSELINSLHESHENLLDGDGEPLPLSLQEAVMDLSHLAGAILSPVQITEKRVPKNIRTSSARKRRIIDSQEDE